MIIKLHETDEKFWYSLTVPDDPHDIRNLSTGSCFCTAPHSKVNEGLYEEWLKKAGTDKKGNPVSVPDTKVWQKMFRDIRYVEFMYFGKLVGWWDLNWDLFPDETFDKDLIMVKISVVKLGDFTTFAACLSELGVFKSIKEGKRNGWNKPLELGDHLFKKKTWLVRVED